jgi:hypothetical protein
MLAIAQYAVLTFQRKVFIFMAGPRLRVPLCRPEFPKVRLHPQTRALGEVVLEEIQHG